MYVCVCVCYLERATGLSRETASLHAGQVFTCYESRSQPMCPSTHFEDDNARVRLVFTPLEECLTKKKRRRCLEQFVKGYFVHECRCQIKTLSREMSLLCVKCLMFLCIAFDGPQELEQPARRFLHPEPASPNAAPARTKKDYFFFSELIAFRSSHSLC